MSFGGSLGESVIVRPCFAGDRCVGKSAVDDRSTVQLLLGFDPEPSGVTDVPDPHFSAAATFDSVLTMIGSVLAVIGRARTSLFHQLKPVIRRRTP